MTHEIHRDEHRPKAGYARVDGDVVEILDGLVVSIPSADEMLRKVHEHRRQPVAESEPSRREVTNEAGPLFDPRTFVIVLLTLGMGFVLYFLPAVGAAALGALTVPGLLMLSRRR